MKKSKLIVGLIALIAILAGVGFAFSASQKAQVNQTTSQYEQALAAGRDAAARKSYAQARNDFTKALSIKKTATAKAYHNQADLFVQSENQIDAYDFKTAISLLAKIESTENGDPVMTKQAKKLKTTLTRVQTRLTNVIEPMIADAKQEVAAGKFKEAIARYDEILALPDLKQHYDAQVKSQVKALRQDAKGRLAETQQSASKSSSNSSSSSQKAKAGSAAQSEAKAAPHASASDLAALRKKLQQLGYSPNPWSDSDLAGLLQTAAKRGHTKPDQVTKADVEAYLKPGA